MKLSMVAVATSLLIFQGAESKEAEGFIVKLKNSISSMSDQDLSALGIDVVDRIPQLNMVVSSTMPYLQSTLVESVTPNYQRSLGIESVNDAPPLMSALGEADSCWGMSAINAEAAWKKSTGSRKIIVAVSDTGAFRHGELIKNLWVNPGETGLDANGKDKSKNGIDDDKNGFIDDVNGWNFVRKSNETTDSHYHGTHVSGTIGALGGDKTTVAGVVWQISLMQVPFIGMDGSGTDADAIKSIIYAADNGAKVLNASWGSSDYSGPLLEGVEYALAKGMIIVAAAGNDGMNSDKKPHFPSGYDSPNIISVAAMGRGNYLAGFSNYGAKSVDLGAPGDMIYSTWNPMYNSAGGAKFYNEISGTSMAAPHVTGAVALLYSINPAAKWTDIKAAILNSAKPNKELKGKSVTGGTLDVGAASLLIN